MKPYRPNHMYPLSNDPSFLRHFQHKTKVHILCNTHLALSNTHLALPPFMFGML